LKAKGFGFMIYELLFMIFTFTTKKIATAFGLAMTVGTGVQADPI
jgi:hypothetical protein